LTTRKSFGGLDTYRANIDVPSGAPDARPMETSSPFSLLHRAPERLCRGPRAATGGCSLFQNPRHPTASHNPWFLFRNIDTWLIAA
jgi:hypothetical protein